MPKQPLWYAVYTKPRWEKKVAELLSKKGVENYCPLNKVQRQWSDRKKIVQEPLFKSYVFVKVEENELLKVRQTDGIINILHWLRKPAIIRENEINAIKNFLDEHHDVNVEKIEVNVDDTIRIIHGPLVSREGNVIEVLNQSVKVVLPSLGYALVANVYKTNIEKITMIDHQKVSYSKFK